MTSYYEGDTLDFVASHEVEGIHTPPVIDKFVLQNDKKFFYGMKGNNAKWTYDCHLALTITKFEADAFAFWLATRGITVIQVSAPRGGVQE
jgi:hypothetical protein